MERRAVKGLGIGLGLAVLAALPAGAEWLPPQVAEGAAQQLAGRLATFGEVSDRERLVEGARGVLGAMVGTIEAWGVDGTVERAPEFERFSLPSSGDRYLDAMGAYSVCSLLLLRQFQSPEFADDQNARFTSTLGLSSLTLAIVRLREPFVAGGGTQPQIEAYLTGADLEPIFQTIQNDATWLADAEARCSPVVLESLEAALQYMAEKSAPSD